MITIIDGDFILYTATAGNKMLDKNNEPIKIDNKFTYTNKNLKEVYDTVDEIMLKMLTKVSEHDTESELQYIGYLGGKDNFRYLVYPEYKANRVNLQKPLFFTDCKQYLIDKYKFNVVNEIEADDAVLITKNLLTENSIIATPDKDLIKCVEGVYLNIKNNEVVKTNTEEANINFWKSLIIGDCTDNIKGIPNKGMVFADKLFLNIDDVESYTNIVLNEYIQHFGEYVGVQEFYKNYMCLKLIDTKKDFILPKIQKLILNNDIIN